jgi:hypothetical protein
MSAPEIMSQIMAISDIEGTDPFRRNSFVLAAEAVSVILEFLGDSIEIEKVADPLEECERRIDLVTPRKNMMHCQSQMNPFVVIALGFWIGNSQWI